MSKEDDHETLLATLKEAGWTHDKKSLGWYQPGTWPPRSIYREPTPIRHFETTQPAPYVLKRLAEIEKFHEKYKGALDVFPTTHDRLTVLEKSVVTNDGDHARIVALEAAIPNVVHNSDLNEFVERLSRAERKLDELKESVADIDKETNAAVEVICKEPRIVNERLRRLENRVDCHDKAYAIVGNDASVARQRIEFLEMKLSDPVYAEILLKHGVVTVNRTPSSPKAPQIWTAYFSARRTESQYDTIVHMFKANDYDDACLKAEEKAESLRIDNAQSLEYRYREIKLLALKRE